MKVLISADMEGIAGVVSLCHTNADHAEYQRFRRLMTAEASAAIAGAIAAGATEVVVNDSHGNMDNILIEDLDSAATLISGSPKPLGMMQGIGPDVDAVILIGYHARSGTAAAILEHTWSEAMVAVHLNGTAVGELGLNAAMAGAFGAPVVFVAGDRATTEEARALVPGVTTVTTKIAISRTAAECIHPSVVCERIRQAAEQALRSAVTPFVVPAPITLRVSFTRAPQADGASRVAGARRIDGRTVEWTGADMPAVYETFQHMAELACKATS